jgi:hypothetical protein
MVYRQLLQGFREKDDVLAPVLVSHFDSVARVDAEELLLLPGMKELRVGDNVVGDVENNSDGLCAEFTDDSDPDSDTPPGQVTGT